MLMFAGKHSDSSFKYCIFVSREVKLNEAKFGLVKKW